VIISSVVIAVVDNVNLVWVFQPGAQKDMFVLEWMFTCFCSSFLLNINDAEYCMVQNPATKMLRL